ncbi:MAG: SIS domain-containing protein [Bacillota bacterium]
MSITRSEIFGQYAALKQTLDCVAEQEKAIVEFFNGASPRRLLFTGCGSSYALACSFRAIASLWSDIPVFAVPAGDLWRNFEEYKRLFDGALVLSVSRSGETSELINAYKTIRAAAPCTRFVSINCREDSTIAELSDFTISMPWAFDESVCQTRCVCCLYTAGMLTLAKMLGKADADEGFQKVAQNGPAFLERNDGTLRDLSKNPWNSVVVLADGPVEGLADEAALAFKEISCLQSNYYHVLDVRHGPIVLIDDKTLVMVLAGGRFGEYEKALVEEIAAKGALVAVCSELPFDIAGVKANIWFGERVGNLANGLILAAACQLASLYKSKINGCDPDRPEGLKPWIELK